MKQPCIYCGEREGSHRDHAPPKCFFPEPRPSNLITVPACLVCNGKYGKDDDQVRNLITSLEDTVEHPAIVTQLGNKRYRSIFRGKGKHKLEEFEKSLIEIDRFSKTGGYLGKHPAFNFDQPIMDRFFDRMARALLYHENSIGYVKCKIEWNLIRTEDALPKGLRDQLISWGKYGAIGDDIFCYLGLVMPNVVSSFWVLDFYGGVEFKILVTGVSSLWGHP